MRAAAVWHEVVGGSETAEAPNWYDLRALRGRRELCVHAGALRVGVFDASESYGHARHARRVCYTDVTVSGSKQLRRRLGAAPAGAEVAREEVVIEAVCVR